MTNPQRNDGDRDDASPPDLAASVAGVVDAALGVGVTLARAMAEATAVGRTVEPLPAGTPPIQAIIRYGVSAVGHVAQAAMAGAQGVRKAATPATAASPARAPAAARAAGPRVQAGATLRVPLSVENPSERPMQGLQPRLRRVRYEGGDVSALVPAACVTFTPAQFDVAPRDFEKLTVQVAVPPEAPEGRYELILALGDDEPDLPMVFLVGAAATP